MPTLQQILDDIDTRLPNTISQSVKIGWINDIQREVFKYMAPTQIYEFFTVADQPLYSLPDDCTIDLIISVKRANDLTITSDTTFTTYTYAGAGDSLSGYKYYDMVGSLGLYPVPSISGYSVKIIYYKRPRLLTASDLAETPDLNEDYHNILTYGCLVNIAKSGDFPNVELANNYQADYNEVLAKIHEDLMKKKVNAPLKKKRANEWW